MGETTGGKYGEPGILYAAYHEPGKFQINLLRDNIRMLLENR